MNQCALKTVIENKERTIDLQRPYWTSKYFCVYLIKVYLLCRIMSMPISGVRIKG